MYYLFYVSPREAAKELYLLFSVYLYDAEGGVTDRSWGVAVVWFLAPRAFAGISIG